jgi:SAM-dependent methyltransferase
MSRPIPSAGVISPEADMQRAAEQPSATPPDAVPAHRALGSDDVAAPAIPWDLEHFGRAEKLADYVFAELAPYVRGDVIEVGAGIGTYSRRILAGNVRSLLTVEPEPGCAAELERRLDGDPRAHNVRELLPEAPALRDASGSADLVICQNMLEHIDDDASSVRAMAAALRPGGHLSILVPAHPRLYGNLDRHYGHYRRYTHAGLARLLGDAGLTVERLYAFNALGVIGWVLQNRRAVPHISSTSLRAYEALLRVWGPLERRLRPPFGLSVVAHARRP